jgi:hypothetical protein
MRSELRRWGAAPTGQWVFFVLFGSIAMTLGKHLTERPIPPADILDGAKTLSRRQPIWTLDAVPGWVQADEYLSWAQEGLRRNDRLGNDLAVCYAKRAICRLIDSFLVHNHLASVRIHTYPEKIKLLSEAGIRIPEIAHDLVIEPRNSIEHDYRLASGDQARHAAQIAELVIKSLDEESKWPAMISLGLNYGPMFQNADNDGESWPWGYAHNPRGTMLVVDMLARDPKAILVDHDHEEVRFARLTEFTRAEAVDLANQLREQRTVNGYFAQGCLRSHFADFKRRLGVHI